MLWVEEDTLVRVLVTVTRAPGTTAPLLSEIVPVMVPRSDWANAAAAARQANNKVRSFDSEKHLNSMRLLLPKVGICTLTFGFCQYTSG